MGYLRSLISYHERRKEGGSSTSPKTRRTTALEVYVSVGAAEGGEDEREG